MTEIAVKIGAKQGAPGITDDLAERLHNKNLSTLIGVVELVVEERAERRDGKEIVKLSITNFEPAVDQLGEDHLRDFQRALFMNRKLHSPDGQLTIDTAEDLEPTVEQVVKANPGLTQHDYAPTTTGECDVCGNPEGYLLHQDTDTLDDPFTIPTDDAEEPPVDDEDPEDDPDGD